MNDLNSYSDLLRGNVQPMDLGDTGANKAARLPYAYLVAIRNALLNKGDIVTFAVATTRPYKFTAQDIDGTTGLTPMTDFKFACHAYLSKCVSADSPLHEYFDPKIAVITQVISVSRLDI